jgi:hypothetical protein
MKTCIFYIQGSDSIQSIQNHFSNLFPSMQISFFRVPEIFKQTDQCVMFSPNVKVNEINPLVNDLVIDITPNMRVSDLENIIKSMGLYVQISCRNINRRFPDSSVSNWLLRDVYGMDVPFTLNSPGEKRFSSASRESVIK